MLKKIISGGQTGADRAALDLAIKFNISHGGWIAKGRKTESGPLPLIYDLKEMHTFDYPGRTKQNILDSNGTVIISRGDLTGGSKLTLSFSRTTGRPNCHIDLLKLDSFEAAIILQSFILENQIFTLNVAGPRASNDPDIYFEVKSLLEAMLYLMFLDSGAEKGLTSPQPDPNDKSAFPATRELAVEMIATDLSLKAKIMLARLGNTRLSEVYFAWLDYLRDRTGMDQGNDALLADLRWGVGASPAYTVEDGIMDILKALKQNLEQTYSLRVLH